MNVFDDARAMPSPPFRPKFCPFCSVKSKTLASTVRHYLLIHGVAE